MRFQIEARDSTSQRVVDALEVYREQHQVYPDVLRELVPEQLAAVPRPRIGLLRGAGDVFTYSGFGDSYLLEFSSVQWVQCGYSPPYTDPDDPNAAGLAVGARDNALEGSWSCAEQPPPLWGTP